MDKYKVMERIKRLLKMAKDSSSPNEAAIAAKRASKMMKKYQIDESELVLEDIRTEGSMAAKKYGRAFARMPDYYQSLAISVARSTDTKVVRSEDRLEFQGYFADVELAHYLMDYLRHQVEVLMLKQEAIEWPIIKEMGIEISKWQYRRNFRIGCVAGIAQRLKEFYGERLSDSKEIVEAKKNAIEKHFGPAEYDQKPASDGHGLMSGFEAGRNAHVSRDIGDPHVPNLIGHSYERHRQETRETAGGDKGIPSS